jgi:hypothetical protein
VQVPRKFHAELIGSSGRNIQAIEARSGAHIHFRGDESDDCVVTGLLTYPHASARMPTYADACWRMVTTV